MIERQNQNRENQSRKVGGHGPFDGLAAATAIGFAMTTQALDMWFGVMSGVAKASQDIFEPKDKAEESAAYSAADKSATAKAKSATRTVVADMERTVQDVAEVTVGLLGGRTRRPVEHKPVEKEPAKTGDVLAFETKPAVRTPAKKIVKAAAKQPAPLPSKTVSNAESESFEPVAAETSPVVSSMAEITAAPTIDRVFEDVGHGVAAGIAEPPVEPTPATPEPTVVASQTATIMPEDFRQPKAIDRPNAPDDLKLIAGIGPKLETVLNGLGVWTFVQLANWSPEEIAWVDDYLGLSGRIARDGWTAQADGLAKGLKAAS